MEHGVAISMTAREARDTPVLDSPAAERNKNAILEQLRVHLPTRGTVLELASGTGQHAVHFAANLPQLRWQPSEPDPALRAAIAERLTDAGLDNVAEPIDLDVTAAAWLVAQADALVCINMIHIAPWAAAQGLLRGAGLVLRPGAPLVLYGPFRRGDAHTAESNAAFDRSLRTRNRAWGVRAMEDVTGLAEANGLALDEIAAMPANNFVVVYRRR